MIIMWMSRAGNLGDTFDLIAFVELCSLTYQSGLIFVTHCSVIWPTETKFVRAGFSKRKDFDKVHSEREVVTGRLVMVRLALS